MAGVYNETDYAWLAGIIDGEGSIMLSHTHSWKTRAPVISVTNTKYEILQHCIDIVGKGTITKKTKAKEHHSQAWDWKIERNSALTVLERILPYLVHSIKSERAKLILTEYKSVTPRNGKYTPEMLLKKAAFEEKFFSLS